MPAHQTFSFKFTLENLSAAQLVLASVQSSSSEGRRPLSPMLQVQVQTRMGTVSAPPLFGARFMVSVCMLSGRCGLCRATLWTGQLYSLRVQPAHLPGTTCSLVLMQAACTCQPSYCAAQHACLQAHSAGPLFTSPATSCCGVLWQEFRLLPSL